MTQATLFERLQSATRERLLRFLAVLIHEFTIAVRHWSTMPSGERGMVANNEAIHRASGHLRDLLEPEEQMTASRAAAIVEAAALLSPDRLAAVERIAPL